MIFLKQAKSNALNAKMNLILYQVMQNLPQFEGGSASCKKTTIIYNFLCLSRLHIELSKGSKRTCANFQAKTLCFWSEFRFCVNRAFMR